MVQSKTRSRRIVRALAALGLACAVVFALFAASAPYLVKHKTVRDALIKSMKEWSNGDVEISGPIKLSSLIALEVEVHDARITPHGGLHPVKSIQAQSLKAIVSFPRLLLARVEFKKVIISSAKIVMEPGLPSFDPRSDHFNMDWISLPQDFVRKTPFSNLVIKRAKVLFAAMPRKPYRSVFISQIKLHKNADGYAQLEGQLHSGDDKLNGFVRIYPAVSDKTAIAIWLKSPADEINFRGVHDLPNGTLIGTLSVISTSAAPTKDSILKIHPAELGDLKISGYLNWTRDKIALDKAAIAVGEYQAHGSIALVLTPQKKRLEGTLAADLFDISPWVSSGHLYQTVLKTMHEALDFKSLPDLDLRLSAERIFTGSFTAGPIALALTSTQDRISADLAEMGVFNGTTSGRMDYTSKGLVMRTSGKGVELDALAQAFGLTMPFKGSANFRLNLKDDFSQKASPSFSGGSGQFSVTVSGANVLETDTLRSLNEALNAASSHLDTPQNLSQVTSLTLDGDIEKAIVHAKLQGQDDAAQVSGAMTFDLADEKLTGQLFVSPNAHDNEQPPAAQTPVQLAIAVLGPIAHPSFSGPGQGRHNLSN